MNELQLVYAAQRNFMNPFDTKLTIKENEFL